MVAALTAFLTYLGVSVAPLAAFVYFYAKATPYREFPLTVHDNIAVAITFAAAVLGFTVPLVASIYYTQSLIEMCLCAGITCLVQLIVLVVLRSRRGASRQATLPPPLWLRSCQSPWAC